MKCQSIPRGKQRGAALITALAFVSIFSLIVGGVAIYSVGNNNLAAREADYASAIHLADAGLNYELRNISKNQFNAGGFTVPSADSPDTGSVAGVSGTFSVWVTDTSGGTWNNSKGEMILYAKGTVNGVSRQISAHGVHGDGLFDNYAVYGINGVNFNGSGSSVIGNLGTNGVYSGSNTATTGQISLNGSNASGVSGSNVTVNPDPVYFPTVDQIVNSTFPGPPAGWSWLSTHNNNGNARTFIGNSTTVSPGTTQVSALGTTIKLSKGAIILPPGDYYFTSIDVHGQGQLIVDNGALSTGGTKGLVRIWVNGNGGDIMSNPITYTVSPNDPSLFRMYYNSPGNFQIDGNTASGGAFYGHNATANASFTITGGSFTYASVIADNVTISGNSSVQFPSGTVGSSSDTFWLWFGIKDSWKEVPINGGSTFPDGTSN